MIAKVALRQKAIELRKVGKTYNEILRVVPVAKSTLSLWLRDVGMAKRQKQFITKKRYHAQLRGGARRKEMRIETSKKIIAEYAAQVRSISTRELLLIGAALYWAEGSKQKEHDPSVGLIFGNSDSEMIALFIVWLERALCVLKRDMILTIYVHENHKNRVRHIEKYWLSVTGLDDSNLRKTVLKTHRPKENRRYDSNNYFGLARITVRNSSHLNRRIQGWICGIIKAQKQHVE